MRHKNSVFHDLLKLVPWAASDRLVDAHGSDALVRKFKSREQPNALLYGQLAGATSLRDIIAGLSSHRARLCHIGGKVPARSTFADANRARSYEVFSGLFAHMLGVATKGLRRKIGDAVRLMDSASLHLAGIDTEWARFSTDVCGAKAPIIYDPDLGRPICRVTAAKDMPIDKDATFCRQVLGQILPAPRFKNPLQSATVHSRPEAAEGLAHGGGDTARGHHRGRHGFRPRQRRDLRR